MAPGEPPFGVTGTSSPSPRFYDPFWWFLLQLNKHAVSSAPSWVFAKTGSDPDGYQEGAHETVGPSHRAEPPADT